jgi:hypothetical protein
MHNIICVCICLYNHVVTCLSPSVYKILLSRHTFGCNNQHTYIGTDQRICPCMYVCMYVCMYKYVLVACIHVPRPPPTHTCTCIHTYMHACMHTYIYIHTYIHGHMHTYTRMWYTLAPQIHTFIHRSACTRAMYITNVYHTCMHTFIHACTRLYIGVHSHVREIHQLISCSQLMWYLSKATTNTYCDTQKCMLLYTEIHTVIHRNAYFYTQNACTHVWDTSAHILQPAHVIRIQSQYKYILLYTETHAFIHRMHAHMRDIPEPISCSQLMW